MSTSYDQVEYDSYPFPQSSPERLATIATLMGMQPAKLEKCRVLELGCSSGGNIIPLADRFAGSSFVGIDASVKAIEKGQAAIAATRMTNIELRQADILDVDASYGQFDYIVIHGVYSWVPAHVQKKVLEIFAERLNENGVAYVSYNTYPGWHFRGMIRDVMAYHAKFFDTPEQQLNEARSLVNFLSKSVPVDNNPYGLLLSRELELLKDKHSYYLYHEFLEEFNVPLYFHQLAERLEQHGLQYLGEADFSSMSASNFPPQVERMLKGVSDDTIRMEQYMDFVRNRMFRQTLVCHKSVTLNREIGWETILSLFVASNARTEQENDLHSSKPVTFARPGSTMTTREPLVKAAMECLAEHWPKSIRFTDLVTLARRKLDPTPQLISPERVRHEQRAIAVPLLRCFATTHVDLSVCPTAFSLKPDELPMVSNLARYQAGESNQLTNLNHQTVSVSDIQRQLMLRLDGKNDRKLVAHDEGSEIRDPARIREMLSGVLESNLNSLAKKALLLPQTK